MEAASLPQPESFHPEALIPEPYSELYEDALQIHNRSPLKEATKGVAGVEYHQADGLDLAYRGVHYDTVESCFKSPDALPHSRRHNWLGMLYFTDRQHEHQIKFDFVADEQPTVAIKKDDGRWTKEREIGLERAAELGPMLSELKSALTKRKTGYIALVPRIR